MDLPGAPPLTTLRNWLCKSARSSRASSCNALWKHKPRSVHLPKLSSALPVAGPPLPKTLSLIPPGVALATLPGLNLPPLAAAAARLFFPQSKSLGIDLLSLSPGLLKKAVYAGSNSVSFEHASESMLHLAEQDIDASTIRRATDRIGQERLAQRDLLVESFANLPLIYKDRSPTADVPDLAVIMTDGGRVQILPNKDLEKDNPAEESKEEQPIQHPETPTVPDTDAASEEAEEVASRERFWREDKVAALLTMSSAVHEADPCPELPEVFRDPLVVLKLAREVGHVNALPGGEQFQSAGSQQKQKEAQEQDHAEEEHKKRQRRAGCPEVESRQVVATRQSNRLFGPMVAALAWSLGLMGATRRAYVADGLAANWSVHKKYFPRFTPIVDFIHVLSYVFSAAMAGRSLESGWEVYQKWIKWIWEGKVELVLEALRQRAGELEDGSKERASVETSLGYLEGQKERMDYGAYRQQGLPIMSSIIESTVKQIGRRVKGSEKFWSEEGLEAVLQLRADFLSDNQPMDHFWEQRAERMTGQRTYQRKTG
jgi:hypothetical protein